MRTHTKTFHIRFTEKEYERLCKHAEKSGLPKTTYIRHMINGCSPGEHPDYAFWAFVKEIHYVGNNLNQLCRMAHQFGNIHVGKLNEVVTYSHHLARRLEVGASRSMRLTAQVSTS